MGEAAGMSMAATLETCFERGSTRWAIPSHEELYGNAGLRRLRLFSPAMARKHEDQV